MIDELDDFFAEVDRGREGKNQGISMGLPKLEGIIDGVCPSVYTLIWNILMMECTSVLISHLRCLRRLSMLDY